MLKDSRCLLALFSHITTEESFFFVNNHMQLDNRLWQKSISLNIFCKSSLHMLTVKEQYDRMESDESKHKAYLLTVFSASKSVV